MEESHERVIAVIDWFRFTCLWGSFVPSSIDGDTVELFSLLKVDIKEFVAGNHACGKLGYDDGYKYAESLNVGTKCRPNAQVKGISEQFIIDMPAVACHQFEDRGGNWLELFEFLCKHAVKINRIDLAQDSIDGLSVDLVKEKIRKGEFACPYRARVQGGKRCDEMYTVNPPHPVLGGLDSSPKVWDDRFGYSATFGNYGSTQELQIYDKSLERQANGVGVTCDSWIRFEARFSAPRAEYVVRNVVVPSLRNGCFGSTVSSVIRGLIEFKGKVSDKKRKWCHLNRAPIWKAYDRFLGGAEAIKIPSCQNKVEATVTRSLGWMDKAWKKTFLRIAGMGDSGFKGFFSGIADMVNKDGFSWDMIDQIKNYFISERKGNPRIRIPSTEDIISNLQYFFDTFCPENPVDVSSKFKEFQEKHPGKGEVESTEFLSSLYSSVDYDEEDSKASYNDDGICLDGLYDDEDKED